MCAAAAAAGACEWEREHTAVGALFNARYGGRPTTDAIAAVSRKLSEAVVAGVTGDAARACAIYRNVRAELGG